MRVPYMTLSDTEHLMRYAVFAVLAAAIIIVGGAAVVIPQMVERKAGQVQIASKDATLTVEELGLVSLPEALTNTPAENRQIIAEAKKPVFEF